MNFSTSKCEYPNICIEPHRVKLPCLGWIRTPETRLPDGTICYATISRESDNRYYVSITYKKEIPDITPITPDLKKTIGLDYKSDGLYTDSNGRIENMPHFYRDAQEKRTKL